MNEIALTRARRGAAWLDKKMPGWRNKIRRNRLDMGHGIYQPSRVGSCGCILAQLGSDQAYESGLYDATAYNLGIKPFSSFATRLGFHRNYKTEDDVTYADLTRAWLKVLREGPQS